MADYYFERECRTPNSEAYDILEDDAPIGRLDLHFANGAVHGTLCVSESLTREMIEELIQTVDDELVAARIDLDLCAFGKESVFNFAAHRRIEHYGLITARTGAEPPD